MSENGSRTGVVSVSIRIVLGAFVSLHVMMLCILSHDDRFRDFKNVFYG